MNPVCRTCSEVIFDRFFLQIKEFSFHEECLACFSCQMLLTDLCYLKNGQVFCKLDYDRQFRAKCQKCRAFLYPEDMVIRNEQRIYHYACFTCSTCGASLQQGDKYVIRCDEIICKNHLGGPGGGGVGGNGNGGPGGGQGAVGGPGGGPGDYSSMKEDCAGSGSEFLTEITRHRDGRRGPKRPRTILTAMQRRQFKASFEISPKPCRKVREALAKDTGLSVRVVQVWFQNQRAKMKKMQRRGKIPPTSPNGGQDKNDKDLNDEFSDDSDDDCLQNPEDGNKSNPNSCPSMDTMINPIDKLYMMQDSYFSQ